MFEFDKFVFKNNFLFKRFANKLLSNLYSVFELIFDIFINIFL